MNGTHYQLFDPKSQVTIQWLDRKREVLLYQRTPVCTYATNLHMIVGFFVSYDRTVVHVFLNPSELHAHCTS